MRVKNLNIYKKVAIVTSGVVLSSFVTYELCGDILFSEKEYEVHKIISQTDVGNQIVNDEYYESNWVLNDAVVLKTPYQKNEDGSITRDIYYRDAAMYSYEELEFIKENFVSQDLLLDQNYIKTYIRTVNNDNHLYFNYKRVEETNQIPSNNNYEVSYATFEEDLNDTQKRQFGQGANALLYGVSISTFLISLGLYIGILSFVIDKLENIKKKEIKLPKIKKLNLTKDLNNKKIDF